MPERSRSMVLALWANAALLAVIAITLLARGGGSILPAAMAQPAIAGGSGLYVTPAQFSATAWGCYVIDVDRQILMSYQFDTGQKLLRLTAARNFSNDRRLGNYNTDPDPEQVKAWADKEADTARVQPPETPRPPVETPGR